jgi:hypothetical protein
MAMSKFSDGRAQRIGVSCDFRDRAGRDMEHQHGKHSTQHHTSASASGHYARLYWMAALSFIAMFILMYAMVDRFSNVFVNANQAYMAGLMAAPMVVIEVLLMSGMYPDKRKNAVIIAAGIVAALVFWMLIRQQGAIGNAQFLRSMIPHHAGAILMCEKLRADDPEIQKLCALIFESQREEIAQMRAKLDRLD